jgi:molybdopterin molybdotransferase
MFFPMPCDRCAEPESRQLTLEKALERMLGKIQPIREQERVSLKHALGRVLAEEVRSPLDLPPFPNSAMDGYALRSGDPGSHQALRVIGTSAAGHPYSESIAAGECVRIFTGAALPPNADAVAAQEDVERDGDEIRVAVPAESGTNVRLQGDEIRTEELLLPTGKVLSPADLGLLASVGMMEIGVNRRLRVALFSTGDELRPVWQPLGPGEIYESNRYVVAAQLAELGVETLDFGNVPDDPEAVRQALQEASGQADAVITSGGASVGEADFVVETLHSLGRIDFWKVAIKPGKPFAFGRIGAAYFFGLPGNPVSAMVTFSQLVRPALLRLMGAPHSSPLRLHAICKAKLGKPPGRLEFQRGLYRRNPDGGFSVEGLPGQGSHRLSSMSRANCFIVLPLENSGVEPGETVEIEPFGAPA